MSQPSYYAIIPAHVRYSKDIEMGAKLLYGEITALTSKEGYCWATNRYFSELYQVEERTIKRWMHSLKEFGFIYVEIVCEGIQRQRRIWISKEVQKMFTKGQKCPGGGTKMSPRGDKNVTHINTLSSTKNEDTPLSPKGDEIEISELLISKLKEIHPKFKEPDLSKWEREIERRMRIDGKSKEDILVLMEWLFKDEFWRTVVHSPKNFFKNFDTMWIKFTVSKTKNLSLIDSDKLFAEKIKNRYSSLVSQSKINISNEYVEFPEIREAAFKFGEKEFKEKVIKVLEKMKQNTEGL